MVSGVTVRGMVKSGSLENNVLEGSVLPCTYVAGLPVPLGAHH